MPHENEPAEKVQIAFTDQSASELLAALVTAGLDVPEGLARALVLCGEEVIEPLCQIMLDRSRWDGEQGEASFWAAIHALHIVGAIGSPRAAGALVELLRRDPGWNFLVEVGPTALGATGPEGIDLIDAYFNDPSGRALLRGTVASGALVRIGHDHPEVRPRVAALLVNALDGSDNPVFNAHLASRAAAVDTVEVQEAIDRAFARGLVSLEIVTEDDLRRVRRERQPWSDPRSLRDLLVHFSPRNLSYLGWISEELSSPPEASPPQAAASPITKGKSQGKKGRRRKHGRR
jgi:hypothetical protein